MINELGPLDSEKQQQQQQQQQQEIK